MVMADLVAAQEITVTVEVTPQLPSSLAMVVREFITQ
jgi:hypothetical protein